MTYRSSLIPMKFLDIHYQAGIFMDTPYSPVYQSHISVISMIWMGFGHYLFTFAERSLMMNIAL